MVFSLAVCTTPTPILLHKGLDMLNPSVLHYMNILTVAMPRARVYKLRQLHFTYENQMNMCEA